MTHARPALEVSGKEALRAGNATLTMDRSSEAMKAPTAVTAKIRRGRAGRGPPRPNGSVAAPSSRGWVAVEVMILDLAPSERPRVRPGAAGPRRERLPRR